MNLRCKLQNKELLKYKECSGEKCFSTDYCCSKNPPKEINSLFDSLINSQKYSSDSNITSWLNNLDTKMELLQSDNDDDLSKIALNETIISKIKNELNTKSNFKKNWVGSGGGQEVEDTSVWERFINILREYIPTIDGSNTIDISTLDDTELKDAIKKMLINLDKPIKQDDGENKYPIGDIGLSPLDLFLYNDPDGITASQLESLL